MGEIELSFGRKGMNQSWPMLDEDLSGRTVDFGGKANVGSRPRRKMRSQTWIVVGLRYRIAGCDVTHDLMSMGRAKQT